MTAATVLAHAHAAGLTLTAEGTRLRWRGPQPPAGLLAELRQHKPELLALLAANDGPTFAPANPEQATDEAADRAAIEAVDGGGEPGWWRLADHMRHATILRGLQATALQRPPSSWPDPDATPSAGAWCSCCRGSRWWCEADAPKGWRCLLCHPPVPGAAVVEVRT